MTADNDLIWRGDVLALLQSGLGLTLGELSRRIAAIPAAEPPTLAHALAVPEVKALVEALEALRNNFGSYKFNSMGDFYCTSKDPEFRQFDEALAMSHHSALSVIRGAKARINDMLTDLNTALTTVNNKV